MCTLTRVCFCHGYKTIVTCAEVASVRVPKATVTFANFLGHNGAQEGFTSLIGL